MSEAITTGSKGWSLTTKLVVWGGITAIIITAGIMAWPSISDAINNRLGGTGDGNDTGSGSNADSILWDEAIKQAKAIIPASISEGDKGNIVSELDAIKGTALSNAEREVFINKSGKDGISLSSLILEYAGTKAGVSADVMSKLKTLRTVAKTTGSSGLEGNQDTVTATTNATTAAAAAAANSSTTPTITIPTVDSVYADAIEKCIKAVLNGSAGSNPRGDNKWLSPIGVTIWIALNDMQKSSLISILNNFKGNPAKKKITDVAMSGASSTAQVAYYYALWSLNNSGKGLPSFKDVAKDLDIKYPGNTALKLASN